MPTNKARLRNQADKLWTEKCFEIWGKQCEVCGKKASHCHHYYPKGLYSHLRYEIANGVPLCFHCHFSKTHKGDPAIHEIIKRKRGQKWYNSLKRKARQKPKPSFQTLGYYQKVIERLEKITLNEWHKVILTSLIHKHFYQ
jgi:5-methylcytosine-specific restriction endonuclease McrA